MPAVSKGLGACCRLNLDGGLKIGELRLAEMAG